MSDCGTIALARRPRYARAARRFLGVDVVAVTEFLVIVYAAALTLLLLGINR